MGVKCAKCGSHNTAEYLYGMPAMNEKLEKDIARGSKKALKKIQKEIRSKKQ